MKLRTSFIQVCSAMLSIIALTNHAQGSVVVPSAYTASGYDLTSLTISGTAYSNLVGSSATIVSSSVTLDLYVNGTLPALAAGSASSASSGLDYRTGAGNIDAGSIFQFGQTITANDRVFISDLGAGDAITLNLIDNSGTAIGNYSLSLAAGNFGSLVSSATYRIINDTTGVDGGTINFANTFVSFQLADFSGSTGDISTATGIKLSVGSTWDPTIVGLAAVPEPSSVCIVTFGLIAFLAFRRAPTPSISLR